MTIRKYDGRLVIISEIWTSESRWGIFIRTAYGCLEIFYLEGASGVLAELGQILSGHPQGIEGIIGGPRYMTIIKRLSIISYPCVP